MKRFFILLIFYGGTSFANDTSDALQKIAPGAEWTLSGDAYSGIHWLDKNIKKPTKAEVAAMCNQMRIEKQKKSEYPSLEEKVNALLIGGKVLEDLKKKISDIEDKYRN